MLFDFNSQINFEKVNLVGFTRPHKNTTELPLINYSNVFTLMNTKRLMKFVDEIPTFLHFFSIRK